MFLVFPKATYFFLCAIVNAVSTYQAQLFMDTFRIPVYLYGSLSALQSFKLLGSLWWPSIADRHPQWTKVIIAGTVGVYVAAMSAVWIPVSGTPAVQMIYLACISGLGQFVFAAAFPLIDVLVMQLVQRQVKQSVTKGADLEDDTVTDIRAQILYGRQRLWGCAGYAAATYFATIAVKVVGYPGMYALLVTYAGILIACIYLGFPKSEPSKTKKTVLDVALSSPLRTLLSDRRFVFFMLLVLVVGYGRGITYIFLSYYLERGLLLSKASLSHGGMCRLVGELLVYGISKPLLQLISLKRMLVLAQVLMLVRLGGYSLLPMPITDTLGIATVYLMEFLGGLTATLCVISLVRLTNDLAPPGCANTAQGVFSGMFSGLAEALAGVLNGTLVYYLNDKEEGNFVVGIRRMFQGSTIVFCMLMSVCSVYFLRANRGVI